MMKRLLDLPENNEIFSRDIQEVRWIRSVSGVGRYTLIALGIVFGLGLLLGGLLWWGYSGSDVYGVVFLPFNLIGNFGNLRGVVELAAVFYGVGLISNERTAQRLDLIRMAVGEQAFVEAKHAITVVRTWRIAAFYIIAQMIGMAGLIGAGLIPLFDASLQDSLEVDLSGLARLVVPIAIPVALVGAVIVGLLLVWQMRALAALSVNVSARTENRGGAIALGFVGWILINTLLGLIYLVLYAPWVIGLIWAAAADVNLSQQTVFVSAAVIVGGVLPLYILLTVVIVYFYYRFVRRRLLRNTVHLLVTNA